eukprot:bmy_06653T0
MLATLRQLMPTLRAARGAGAAWPRLSDQPKEGPSLATELLRPLLQGAQASLDSLVEAAEDLAQERLVPPGLVELWALLWRPQGPGGPLEAVAEALCSARGPSKPGGPSLTWYEASDLKELVGQEPARALPHHSLSGRASFPAGEVGLERGRAQGLMVHPLALGSTRTELMGALDAHPLFRRLWGRLKPLVLGKVVFSSWPR